MDSKKAQSSNDIEPPSPESSPETPIRSPKSPTSVPKPNVPKPKVSQHSKTTTFTKNVNFQEILDKIEEPPSPARPIFTRLAHAINAKVKQITEKALVLTGSKKVVPAESEKKHGSKFNALLNSARKSIGASALIRELRAKEEEYLQEVERLLTTEKVNTYAEDHPYVALRKRIEAMSRTGKEEYKIQYQPLLNNPRISDTKIPIYGTGYENERKKQARRRQFMFGLGAQDLFDPDLLDEYMFDPTEKPDSMHWGSKQESDISFLALVFSVSNLFRFPHACYVNGGIVFFLVYCFLIVTLIRPLIFFELLIGQFSWRGEWGFGRLHRYAKGFPHALTFVNLTFVTLNNAILGYAGLYAIGAISNGPGHCDPEWTTIMRCIPYDSVENSKSQLVEKRKWIQDHFHEDEDGSGLQNATLFLSTELFFRYYIINWKGKISKELYHWKFVLAFVAVMFVVIPASVQTHLVSTISRMWIYFACILPVLLSVVLFHQYAFRDGYHTPRYFAVFNWGRLGTLRLWRDALEMSFTTVGVGYGVFIRVAASNDFRFNKINQTSWIISITVMAFCLLCSMVVYTELGILGLIAEAKEFTHIFAEGFGVSFVCLSGALVKILPEWAFSICFAGMNIFNVWAQIVATHMSTQYVSEMIPVKRKSLSLTIGLIVTVLAEIILISIYAAHAEFATSTSTDSLDLYGGSGAACTILLAEVGIAFLLWGYREFMTDIEIMLDKQPSFTYQIQMKYFIPPALLVALFMISLSWLRSPPRRDGQNLSLQTYYFAIVINTMPVAIMAFFALKAFRQRNKVAPSVEESKLIEKTKGLELYWKGKSRWMDRRTAVATIRGTNNDRLRSSLWTDDALRLNIYSARELYYVHNDLKNSLRDLLAVTKTKALWRKIINKVIRKRAFKSVVQIARFLMRRKETKRLLMEATFLKNLIHQCSVCDLAAASVKHLEGELHDGQEMALLNHLMKNTDLESSDESTSSVSTVEFDEPQGKSRVLNKETDSSRSSYTSGESRLVLRKVLGQQNISYAEKKLDIQLRIKKALGLPWEKEMTELTKMRTLRLQKEATAPWWSMVNPPPEEHFITIKVTKRQSEGVILNIRVIILRCSDHFVLLRLPVPRPLIIHATNEELESLPGAETYNKLSNLVMRSLKRTLWEADLDNLGPENKTPLLDNLDRDVYRFIDPIRSCVVILESDQEAQRLKDKWRWLENPTRRQHRLEEIPFKREIPFEIEQVTIAGMTKRQIENERIDKMLAEPSDIVYHRPSTDVWSPESLSPPRSRLSSSSSSYEDPEIPPPPEVVMHRLLRHGPQVELLDETAMKQNTRAIRKNMGGGYSSNTTTQNSVSNFTVKHLTNEDWKKTKTTVEKPILVLHEKPAGVKTKLSVKYMIPQLAQLDDGIEITEREIQPVLDDRTSVQSIWSEAEPKQRYQVKKKKSKNSEYSVSTAVSSSRSIKDFSNLRNNYDELAYYTDGKTLIIEPRNFNRVIVMASSENSIASLKIPAKQNTLTRVYAKTDLESKEYV